MKISRTNITSQILLLSMFSIYGAGEATAQFIPTSTAETTYPLTPINPVDMNHSVPPTGFSLPSYPIPGLQNNAHMSTVVGVPGDPVSTGAQIAEVSAWTEVDGKGWEDGYFNYGYTDHTGTYVGTGTEFIEGAKYLHAAYMTDGINGFIVVSYVSRQQQHNWQVVAYDYSVAPAARIYGWVKTTPWNYNFEYRIYNWNVPTSTATLAKRGFVSGSPTAYEAHPLPDSPVSIPHPKLITSGPLAPGYEGIYPHEGTMVMDVSKDARKVAFAYTCNGNWVQLKVGELIGSNPPTLNLSSERTIAAGDAKNPLDIAFRHDPTFDPMLPGEHDLIHTLFEDGSGGYLVSQSDYAWAVNPATGYSPRADDANVVTGTVYQGTALPGGLYGHLKLDVPDESIERKWAYTWSDASNIYLKRYSTPSSSDPGSGSGTAVFDIINNGTLLNATSAFMFPINGMANESPTVAFKADAMGTNKNILVGWATRATLPYSGAPNYVAVELLEAPAFPGPLTAISAVDYLDIQSSNSVEARNELAFSHHSATTADLLYTCFTQGNYDEYLQHKNHQMSVAGYWRPTNVTEVSAGTEKLEVGPNPFNNNIFIRGTENANYHCEIVNILGRSEFDLIGNIPDLNAKLAEVAPALIEGIYFLRLKKEGGNSNVFKLTKSNIGR